MNTENRKMMYELKMGMTKGEKMSAHFSFCQTCMKEKLTKLHNPNLACLLLHHMCLKEIKH